MRWPDAWPGRRGNRRTAAARVGAIGVALAMVVAMAPAACRRAEPPASKAATATPPAAPDYVGRAACASCHQAQDQRFRGSHHDLAMQVADGRTVLGDFSGTTFVYAGTTSRFTRHGDRFVVRTDGPDGQLQEYDVAYVFGVYPLQQYLIAFPGGRYQALGVAWDARPKAAGGQRWFHLYEDDRVTHGDPLHWTQFSQNWNAQCATCHSTRLRKGYDRAANRYATTWAELNVSCEACHGPGSAHVAWARGRTNGATGGDGSTTGLTVSLRERAGTSWVMQPSGIARRSAPPANHRAEVEVCAPCHSRRVERFEGHTPGSPFLDSYRPSLLADGLYRADGQMQDEVYIYGSFLQSRMYAAGVTCADCHEPHGLKVRAEGNALCAQCHAPATFDTRAHHGHAVGSTGASCVACHMPTETYMGVDRRHDHGFRVPRPDLAARLSIPDACSSCHTGQTAAWAAAALDRQRGRGWRSRPEIAATIAAARAGRREAAPAVAALAADASRPAIVRATAVELLPRVGAPDLETQLVRLAGDQEPLVRSAVAQALNSLPAASRANVGGALLRDPLRAIRVDAAQALAGESVQWLPAPLQQLLPGAITDLVVSDTFNGDRPESHLSFALLAEQRGDVAGAVSEYQTAIDRFPWYVAPYVNLADLQRAAGDEPAAESTLRRALRVAPDDAGVSYALGLALYRQQRVAESVAALARASTRDPATARYALAHALALDALGRRAEARAVLGLALQRHPDDAELRDALGSLAGPSSRPDAPGRVR
jgi:predicted CXXCH cytochrome family protein